MQNYEYVISRIVCNGGCVCVYRILALEKLGAVFNQISTPLRYTPRKFAIDTESNNLVIIETDHNTYNEETKKTRKETMAKVCTV